MQLLCRLPLTAIFAAVCVLVILGSAEAKSASETPASNPAQAATEGQLNGQEPSAVAGMPPSLPKLLAARAKSYKRFYSDVSEISGIDFQKPDQIHSAIDRLTAHDPVRLAEGWIAYAADIAINTPSFYAAFSERMIRQGQDHLLMEISTKPGFVYALPESSAATQLIVNMIAVETELMVSLGETFVVEAKRRKSPRQAKASSQAQRYKVLTWSQFHASPRGSAQVDRVDSGRPLWLPTMSKKEAAASTLSLPTIDASPNMPPVMKRILDLAGRIIIDAAAGPEQDAAISLMTNSRMARCLKWADLNMKQCKAAAKGSSEFSYCAGSHALAERADCWTTLISVGNGS